MKLEEYGKYKTVNRKKVDMQGITENHKAYFNFQLVEILKLGDTPYEELEKWYEDQKILNGTTNDKRMPGGYRHQQSGKCIGGEIPGNLSGEELEKFIAGFDITDDKQRKIRKYKKYFSRKKSEQK